MILNYYYFKNLVPPEYILCKSNGDRIGIINATEKTLTKNFNTYDEIKFCTYMYIDNIKNPYYDRIVGLQYIELPLIGRFVISDLSIHSESDYEYKECTALSEEVLLGQKYLENFSINIGTVESIDNVRFYHQTDPRKSLLHLILDKCPDWEIGHIDSSLIELERCFEINRQDIYSTLMNDVAAAFQCIFLFDTIHHRINIYAEDIIGNDTNIFVSYENLLKSTDVSYSIENIKTCLTVTGADELNLREVNMGYSSIYNLSYFHSLEYMSQQLYDEYNTWIKKWNNYTDTYKSLIAQYQQFYNKIRELESTKIPTTAGSTNWSEYGLNPLKEQLEIYQQKLTVMMKSGQGDSSHKDYKNKYLPCYNTIQSIQNQISIVQNQLTSLYSQQKSIGNQMNTIIDEISMTKNFSVNSLKELTKWIREDELSSDNFVVVDTMTDSERMDMLDEMLKYGQKELAKVSQPELEFRSDIINLFNIPDFQSISPDFEPGNYIHVYIRDDYIIKARVLSMDIDWLNPENFNITFGNVMKLKGSSLFENVTEALGLAQSAATSVSMNSSNWNKANKEASDIMGMLSDGLAAAGQVISTSSADVLIDDRGILVSNIPESLYPNDRIFIGGSQILFSDDDFKTVRTGIGRLTYTKKGVIYNDFGVLADFVIAGYIAGSVIEGDEIIGGTIIGSDFNNGNDTFHVDKYGNLTASSADIKGIIKADTGYIGGSKGFTIKEGKIYSGEKSTFASGVPGIYLGTDGIKLGNSFSVNNNGYIISTNGKIGGFDVTDTYIANGAKSLGENNNSVYLGTDGISLGKTFKVTKAGALTSSSGKIASFTISGDSLISGNVGMCSNTTSGTIAFWAGHATKTLAPFRVTNQGKVVCDNMNITGGSLKIGDNFEVKNDGSLIASNATITGVIKADSGYIGGVNGFTIESNKLYSGRKNLLNSNLLGIYLGTDGISLGSKFKVTSQGKVTCSDIDITGGSITVGNNFSVNSSGDLVSSNATITGIIKANTGYIGGINGWTIKTKAIYTGNKSTLSSTSTGTYLGADGISIGSSSKYIKYSASQGKLEVKGDIYADYVEANSGNIGDWKITEGRLESISDRSIIKGGIITGSTVNGGTINGSSIYGGDKIEFEATSDTVDIGNFTIKGRGGNRHFLQSKNSKVGMSSTAGDSTDFLWAGDGLADDGDSLFQVTGSRTVIKSYFAVQKDGREIADVITLLFQLQDKYNNGTIEGNTPSECPTECSSKSSGCSTKGGGDDGSCGPGICDRVSA